MHGSLGFAVDLDADVPAMVELFLRACPSCA